jgi:hypothetical protein
VLRSWPVIWASRRQPISGTRAEAVLNLWFTTSYGGPFQAHQQ